jgi:hypothetical protein
MKKLILFTIFFVATGCNTDTKDNSFKTVPELIEKNSTAQVDAALSQYEAADYGLKFEYPKEWKVERTLAQNFRITKDGNILDLYVNSYPREISYDKETYSENKNINGIDFTKLKGYQYSAVDMQPERYYVTSIFENGFHKFWLEGIAEAEVKRNELEKVIDQIVPSIHFDK